MEPRPIESRGSAMLMAALSDAPHAHELPTAAEPPSSSHDRHSPDHADRPPHRFTSPIAYLQHMPSPTGTQAELSGESNRQPKLSKARQAVRTRQKAVEDKRVVEDGGRHKRHERWVGGTGDPAAAAAADLRRPDPPSGGPSSSQSVGGLGGLRDSISSVLGASPLLDWSGVTGVFQDTTAAATAAVSQSTAAVTDRLSLRGKLSLSNASRAAFFIAHNSDSKPT